MLLDLNDSDTKSQMQISIVTVALVGLLALLAPKAATSSSTAYLSGKVAQTQRKAQSNTQILKHLNKLVSQVENRKLDKGTRLRYLERLLGNITMLKKLSPLELLQSKDVHVVFDRASQLQSALCLVA